MSTFSYPTRLGRGRAVLGSLLLGAVSAVSSPGAIVGVTLQQGTGPANPTPTDYSNAPTTAYYASYNFPTATATTVRFSFSNLLLFGGQFFNLTQLAAGFPAPGPYSLGGNLVSAGLSVTLHQREPNGSTTGETWASDLTILVAPGDGSFSNLSLQVGGGSTNFGSSPWIFWSESSTQPTPYSFSDTQAISPAVALSATPALTDPVIWLGHGFDSGAGASYGRWSGYVELTFSGSGGGSGVPDDSRTALLLAPGALLLLGLAGRTRRRG